MLMRQNGGILTGLCTCMIFGLWQYFPPPEKVSLRETILSNSQQKEFYVVPYAFGKAALLLRRINVSAFMQDMLSCQVVLHNNMFLVFKLLCSTYLHIMSLLSIWFPNFILHVTLCGLNRNHCVEISSVGNKCL